MYFDLAALIFNVLFLINAIANGNAGAAALHGFLAGFFFLGTILLFQLGKK